MSAERILDAAAGLFADHGVGGVGMGEVARAAGCSRATLYRYFADRHELHVAFVHREARRVGAAVVAGTQAIADPAERLAAAVLAAADEVRAAPALLAWFADGDAARTAELAQSSAVIEALGLGLVHDHDDPDDPDDLDAHHDLDGPDHPMATVTALPVPPAGDGYDDGHVPPRRNAMLMVTRHSVQGHTAIAHGHGTARLHRLRIEYVVRNHRTRYRRRHP